MAGCLRTSPWTSSHGSLRRIAASQPTSTIRHHAISGTSAGRICARICGGQSVLRVKEFHVGCSKTINLGHYNSLKVEASLTVAMDPDEDIEQISARAQKELYRLLEETYQSQYKSAKDYA